MNVFTELLILAMLGVVIFGLSVFIVLICSRLPFIWTTIEENHAMIIVKGDQYHKTIVAKRGWRIKDDGSLEVGQADQNLLYKLLGIHYIGIPLVHSIYQYTLEWVSWKMDEKMVYRAIPKRENFGLVYLADYPYYVEVTDVETKDLIPFSFSFIITGRVINPYKAVFLSHDWVRQMTAIVQGETIKYAGVKTFQEITSDKSSSTSECASTIIKELKPIMDDLYGITIVSIAVWDINPNEKFRELTLRKTEAVKSAEAVKATAEGTAEATRINANGQADAIRVVAEAQATALKNRAEALTQSGEAGKMIVQADIGQELAKNAKTTVISADSLIDTISKILGGRKP